MILTGPEIASAVAAGEIHIDDFTPERLEPNSYGFRLAPELLCYEEPEFDSFQPPEGTRVVIGDEGYLLRPGWFYLAATMEAMGSPRYAATLYACRSISTLGMWIQFSAPLGHCGAIFPWTLEIAVANPIRVYPGMVIGKLAFWVMQGEESQYSGKYTGSRTTVASRLSEENRTGPRWGRQP